MVPRSIPDTPHAEQLTFSHGLINYKDTKTKCRHLKNDMQGDFAAGVSQSLQAGDTVSYVGIFDPAL